jgi:hypothetical protein
MLNNALHKGSIYNYGSNGTHCSGGVRFSIIQIDSGLVDANGTPILINKDVEDAVLIYSASSNFTSVSEISMTPTQMSLFAANATLNNVAVWSANSILTRDYADGRYAAISATIDGGTALTTNTGSYDGGDAIAN